MENFLEILNELETKSKSTKVELELKIKFRLSEYLGFDIDNFLNSADCATVFGGSIRDILADAEEIHDVDIMVLPESARILAELLKKHGFISPPNLGNVNIHSMYSDIHCIFEPWNFIKFVDGRTIVVQLIRPGHGKFEYAIKNKHPNDYFDEVFPDVVLFPESTVSSNSNGVIEKTYKSYFNSCGHDDFEHSKKCFEYLMNQVDIIACGVNYNARTGLVESCEDAMLHCFSKIIKVNKEAVMYNKERTNNRKYKLESRGWFIYDNLTENEQKLFDNTIERIKLLNLLTKKEDVCYF